jgi:UDP-galactopyranose mutase
MDILCFSHLRWDFVFQRPQHLLSRFTSTYRVFFIEEPVFGAPVDFYNIKRDQETNVWIIVPHLVSELSAVEAINRQRVMVDYIMHIAGVTEYITWYYTPMALPFSDHLTPLATVYDCMDELSAFKFAPPELLQLEQQLFKKADVVFVGGQSLYEAKQKHHHNIYAFPSSIDKNHFITARLFQTEPEDQEIIQHPKLGFFGVIDERFDRELIREVAMRRPDLNFVFIGPVVKVDPEGLPHGNNIHYLGNKSYQELPRYLSGWDIAIMPFAHNDSTRFISPTKTPEYLAGGQPVISTSIRDVVRPYGEQGLAHIADTPDDFIKAVDQIINMSCDDYAKWLTAVDRFLEPMSWDNTYQQMEQHIHDVITTKFQHQKPKNNV